MIRHLFRLAWNQRRANGLILFEILVCFLVLCALLTGVVFLTGTWLRPLGFDYHDVLIARLERTERSYEQLAGDIRTPATLLRLLQEARGFPEVSAAALSANTPWSGSGNLTTTYIAGRPVTVGFTPVTPELLEVLDLKLIQGRWIEEADAALNWRPTVLTETLARGYFGAENPVGKTVPEFEEGGKPAKPDPNGRESRVVGVVRDYRRDGDFATRGSAMFVPGRFDSLTFGTPEELLIRLRPGASPAVQERLLRAFQAVEPNWSYTIDPLSRLRQRRLIEFIIPLVALGLIAHFLVLMVGLGLLGVLWQGVARRTAEFGVRRAMGATRRDILTQILGEISAIATLAVMAGTFLFLQLPLLRAFPFLNTGTYLAGLTGAMAMIYSLVLTCGFYPGWLATRVDPALALKHD